MNKNIFSRTNSFLKTMKARHIIVSIILFLILCGFSIFVYKTSVEDSINEVTPRLIENNTTDITPVLNDGFNIIQEFQFSGELYGIELLFATYLEHYDTGDINIYI